MEAATENNKDQTGDDRKISLFTYMSGTGRKLIRWEKNDLITMDQLFAILEYERVSNGKRLFRSLVGLALFAIAMGVLAIIAANWSHIPGGVKVGAHFLLNIAAACAVWKYHKERADIKREGATLLFFALNLTMIVLIGQVFQLGGNYAGALTLWMVMSSPAVFLFGKSPINAVPWVLAFLATIWALLVDFISIRHEDLLSFLVFLGAGLYVPLVLAGASGLRAVTKHRPEWSQVLFRFALLIFAIQATGGSFMWYGDVGDAMYKIMAEDGSYTHGYTLMLGVIAIAFVSVLVFERIKTALGHIEKDRTGYVFVIVSMISATMPLILMSGEVHFIAAVHFCAYWLFAGWVGYRLGYNRLINAAVTLITLRIIVIYFELFGGLMFTGFGLIFSGILSLAILKGAMRVHGRIMTRQSANENASQQVTG